MKPTVVLLAALFFCGCATTGVYHRKLTELLKEGDYSSAAALCESSFQEIYGRKDELLYHLDIAFLYHLSGDYQKSNEHFERAKRISAEHFTKSISAEAATLLVSDNIRPYYGEDFERALIHAFSAINYFLMGQKDSALVEARQVDHFLNTLRVNYGQKSTYKEDAFARYLMGIFYESAGEINNAFISYRKALDAYMEYTKTYLTPVPERVVKDTYKTAAILGFSDELKYIRRKYPSISLRDKKEKNGEVAILIYMGLSPVKIDSFFEISFAQAWLYVGKVEAGDDEVGEVEKAKRLARSIASEEQVVMAFPKYVDSHYKVVRVVCEVMTSSGIIETAGTRFEMVKDIGSIAKKSLDERIDRIRIRTIARAALKFVLSRQISEGIEKKSDKAIGWLVNKVLSGISAATELADKRSWRTLPDKILLNRMSLPEGRYDLRLIFYDIHGDKVTERLLRDVEVYSGRINFKLFRVAL